MGKNKREVEVTHFTQGKFNPGIASIVVHWLSVKILRAAVWLAMDNYNWSDTGGPVTFSMQALMKVLQNAESGGAVYCCL